MYVLINKLFFQLGQINHQNLLQWPALKELLEPEQESLEFRNLSVRVLLEYVILEIVP